MQLSIGFSSFELGTQAVQALVVFIGWADLGAWRGLIPLVATEDRVTKGFKLRITEAEEKEALSVPGSASQVLQVLQLLQWSDGIRWDQKLLPGASVAHQWWPSGAVLNVDSRISEDCEAFILGTPHGLRVFFWWRFWEFFCDCSSCDLKKTWLPQFLRLLHRMEAAPVVKEGPAFASCHELFRWPVPSGGSFMRFTTISDYQSTDEQLEMLKLQSCTPYPFGCWGSRWTRPKGRSSSSTESTKCMEKEDRKQVAHVWCDQKWGGDTCGIPLS